MTYREFARRVHNELMPEQQDMTMTGCSTDGQLFTVNGELGIQTQNNGSVVIDPETPIFFLEKVN